MLSVVKPHLLQHRLLQREVSDELLELATLLLKLLKAAQLSDAKAGELPFPCVEGLLADADLPAHLDNGRIGLSNT